ncbi:MAG TPA: Verru_Chthon cassette protein A [Verrucomicrobium sp.]|nr:Verru_Chthon cassette protein A [Verrucomicrobium sp.]
MKGFLNPPDSLAAKKQSKGIALIMVLSSIAIVAMLVLAFLMMARGEQRSAAAFSDIVDARNLADLPVNLAIGQIRRATEQNGMTKTWASQPGMIRVFGTEPDALVSNARAKTLALYKLYSDDTMVVTPSGGANGMTVNNLQVVLKSDVNDLAKWQDVPGMYVDINEPAAVMSAGSKLVQTTFPIADPRAIYARDNGLPVEGFNFNDRGIPGGAAAANINDVSARLPMPVKWLYQLAGGQLLVPKSGDATHGLSFEAAPGTPSQDLPSVDNPIVGRIAFWTDDESTKINVNTATEGTAWDSPRAFTQTNINFARRQPAQNEYSRYPGHPAQTSLSPVFQAFGEPYLVDFTMNDTRLAAAIERYHRLSPRTPWGGSFGGTQAPTAAILTEKDDRLYATLDELVFDRSRVLQNPVLTQRDIASGRFFLTAHSRAPELNLFNQPRIMLWPISANTAERSAKDKLLAFVGTGGGKAWYFSRTQNFKDLNTPGSAQDPKGDLDLQSTTSNVGLKRNRELYEDHLVPLTGGVAGAPNVYNIPGFGGNFASKYTVPRRNQILTEMVDFMRWSVNSYNTGLLPNYYYLPQRTGKLTGESSAVPLIPGNDTKGFGRWPTITEAAIIFMATDAGADGKATKMQAFIALEPFSPTTGAPVWSANVRYKISGLDGFKSGVTPLGFSSSAMMRCNTANGYLDDGHLTAFTGFASQFKKSNRNNKETNDNQVASARVLTQANEDDGYPFYSSIIDAPSGAEFEFSGGTITVEVLTGFGAASSAKTVQTLQLYFPKTFLKVPRVVNTNFKSLASRFQVHAGEFVNSIIQAGDTTRSVEIDVAGPSKGDMRLLAAMSQVPPNWFKVDYDYDKPAFERVHFLRGGNQTINGQYGPGDPDGPIGVSYRNNRASTLKTAGSLVKGVTYARDCTPAVARGQDGVLNAYNRLGDFDNGSGKVEDGPYINKADESNLASNKDPLDKNLNYFGRGGFSIETGETFSPNRQIASAVAFGSLPSGTFSDKGTDTHKPWQTLLFCPNPPSRVTSSMQEPNENDHEGFKGPRDHLWLDLFWMPVVEPYAISEGFSTAGKINMNYQMQPFTYVERSTGIYAALKATTLSAITPRSVGGLDANGYNNLGGENYKEGSVHKYDLNYQVNRLETLKGFARRFTQGDVFRSATEICDIFLVPQRKTGVSYNSDAKMPPAYENLVLWWNGNQNMTDAFEPTGDNSREAPYNQLYPRLTTKSNTYTVHYRVQTLKKARSTDAVRWIEGTDSVVSENRGSATLERYLDPNDKELATLPSVAQGGGQSWDRLYRFRILERKQFTP